jgi:hypothetical protein
MEAAIFPTYVGRQIRANHSSVNGARRSSAAKPAAKKYPLILSMTPQLGSPPSEAQKVLGRHQCRFQNRLAFEAGVREDHDLLKAGSPVETSAGTYHNFFQQCA